MNVKEIQNLLEKVGTVTLTDVGISIIKSGHVRVDPLQSISYYEVTPKALSARGVITITECISHTLANENSLARQKLQEGDVLVPLRSKFKYAGIITKEMMKSNMPVVAINGFAIIRTGSEDKARLVRYWLELPPVTSILNQSMIKNFTKGTKPISVETIRNLEFPDMFDTNLSKFKKYSQKILLIMLQAQRLPDRVQRKGDRVLFKSLASDGNIEDIELQRLEEFLSDYDALTKKYGFYLSIKGEEGVL